MIETINKNVLVSVLPSQRQAQVLSGNLLFIYGI